MELNDMPVIDWNLSMKLAGNKADIAEEMLKLFVSHLPQDISLIKQYHKSKDYLELQRLLHRLRGALCYCGLPRLKTVIIQLETELKNNIMTNLASLFCQLDKEAMLVLNAPFPAREMLK